MLHTFPKAEQRVIQLYQSGEPASIDLAEQLEQSLRLDLLPFWEAVSELYYTIPKQFVDGELKKKDLIQLVNKPYISILGKSIRRLPTGLFFLDKLWFVRADNADIAVLPDTIHQLRSLKRLSLVANKLRSLPDNFCRLSLLEEVNLGNNQLQILPERIGDLTNLNELRLHHNQLHSLPSSIGQLTSLYELTLGNNQLTRLPEEIQQLKQLQFINLENNPISAKHREEIITWLPNTHIYWGK